MINLADEAAEMLNSPLALVLTPACVPFTNTEALIMASPFSSITFPVTDLFWAHKTEVRNKNTKTKIPFKFFFICSFLFW